MPRRNSFQQKNRKLSNFQIKQSFKPFLLLVVMLTLKTRAIPKVANNDPILNMTSANRSKTFLKWPKAALFTSKPKEIMES